MTSITGKILKQFVGFSNKLTELYEEKFGFECDVYFPTNAENPGTDGNFDDVNIFSTHGTVTYSATPDLVGVRFYIPHLFKKQIMNSPESSFENFNISEESLRPFIETSFSKELPYASKIKVYVEDTELYFITEKVLAVPGADGHMLIRQTLIPLAGER